MILYLVQHGKAKSSEEDHARPLSSKGLEEVRKVAAWSAQIGLKVDQIRHSGKKRAEQTAEIFAEKIKPGQGVKAVEGLGPMDDINPVADELNREEKNLMLVGHLPFLSRLVSRLVAGNPDKPLLQFQNAAIVCLVRQENQWIFEWYIIPSCLG